MHSLYKSNVIKSTSVIDLFFIYYMQYIYKNIEKFCTLYIKYIFRFRHICKNQRVQKINNIKVDEKTLKYPCKIIMRKIDLNYIQTKFIKCRIKLWIIISLLRVHTHLFLPYICEYIYRII